MKVDVSIHNRTEVDDLLRRSPYMRGRGSWTPRDCAPRHRVAVIIPYRDRLEHLTTLLHTLHPLLQRQLIEYRVYVVEQFGNDTFNKGVLMNAGVREALKDSDFHCFVFHDVDMIPEDDRNMYTCPFMPRHMSVAVDKFNYTLPYTMLVGGVFAIKLEHFLMVNGYSNLYWGWGGEDDDMAYRIKYRKLEIIRPPETLARYSMIKHDHRPESPNAIRTALLRMAKKRSSRDGLNTVKYRVLWRHDLLAYTHLMIDIGKHHRWQFLNG
ncbi:Beta-1,4-N-acetylgalactosaminyltransferase bre-4, partial [Stegodyphus mimosarum]